MFVLKGREAELVRLSALVCNCEIVYVIGVEKMSCEEYIVEINKMLSIALERRDLPVLSFIYKLLCKYVQTV